MLGAVPLGPWTGAQWMIPVSLAGALAMLFTFAGALQPAFRPVTRSMPDSLSPPAAVVSRN